jgi:prophage regulatory protein
MKFISIDELPEKGIRYSKPHIYRLIRAEKFPKPVQVGENRIAFVESEIDDWMLAKIAERDTGAGAAPRPRGRAKAARREAGSEAA